MVRNSLGDITTKQEAHTHNIGGPRFHDADFWPGDVEIDTAHSRLLLQKILRESAEELDWEYLMLTDGMEELLADPDKVIRSASYNYLMLQRLSVEMGVHATAREMCRILGIKFDPNKHVASIKYAKVPDLSFHDAQKSDRRLHKAAKRRKYMDRILGIRRRNCG